MQQFTIVRKNGVVLDNPITEALEVQRIVLTRVFSATTCEILYAKRDNRRVSCDKIVVNAAKSQVDALLSEDAIDLTVYDDVIGGIAVSNSTATWTVQPAYLSKIVEGKLDVAGTVTSVRVVTILEGSFAELRVFVSDSMATLASAAPTTTTTTEAATTTTTEAAATTTTEAPATTTTTEAAATTTTTAG